MTPLYAGIGGVVRELTEMDAGINGVVTPLTEMWAGIGGVERQIFSATQTWEKWDTKTTYKYVRQSTKSDNDIFIAYGTSYKFYSKQLPAVTSSILEEKPKSLSQIFPSLIAVSAPPILSPITQAGYYVAYGDVNRLTLSKIFYMDVGESLTKDPDRNYYYIFPSKRTTYYASERKTIRKGDNLLGSVTAPKGTYPSNGAQDGYWWVLVE